MKNGIQILLIFLSVTGFAQNTISFKGQIYHNKLGPQKNLSLLIDNQYPAVTNDAGLFIVGLPKGTTHIKISLSTTNYTILYPYGGYVPIPLSPDEVPQIIIGNPKENDYLNQYLSIYKLIKQLQKTPSAHEDDLQELQKKMSSLDSQLIKLNYSATEIRTARQIQDGKDDYLPEISADLIDYRTNASDLKTAFKYVSDYAFDNHTALQMLVEAITKYNYSYNKLDRQHVNYEKRIADYWQNDSARIRFNDLMKFSLETLHLQKILPMQESIARIREYFNSPKKNNDLKKIIQQKINEQVQEVDKLLPTLEKGTNELLSLLSN